MSLGIDGMTCTNCAMGLQRSLERAGLGNVRVDFISGTADFELPRGTTLQSVVEQVRSLGFSPRVAGEPVQGFWTLPRRLLWCLLFTVPLMLHMVSSWHPLHDPLVQLFLCVPVYLVGGLFFWRSALTSLRQGVANMDVLIILGATAALAYSLWGTLAGLGPSFVFYETSASIITIVIFGNFLEQAAVRKTSTALRALAELQSVRAKRILVGIGGEKIQEIDGREILVGDQLLVNTGDRIPTDGEVYWGNALLNEGILTGESAPQSRAANSRVTGGSVVVQGSVKMRATAVGEDTMLAGIVRLVRDAQTSAPKIQRLADRVSAVFVPIVLAIALLTFIASWCFLALPLGDALLRMIAVLVVACPCAMGLATPTAVVIGVGRAAQEGILVKGGETLERCAGIKIVAFDKTGTLTTGKFTIGAITLLSDIPDDQVRAWIKGLEVHSSHPLARSFVEHLADLSPEPFHNIVETAGEGIAGQLKSGEVISLVSRSSVSAVSEEIPGELVLLRNGTPAATIALGDSIRPHARASVENLRALDLRPVLISGDSSLKVTALAQEIGITEAHAQTLPQGKMSIIEDLKLQGAVAFVGDGINDAPALTRADIGIALSDGTQSAMEAAQVVLLGGDLLKLERLVKIARNTLTTIKQNLFWAFFYNILAIPCAAAGYLTPMVAAAAMIFSDLVVIGNSLRFKARSL